MVSYIQIENIFAHKSIWDYQYNDDNTLLLAAIAVMTIRRGDSAYHLSDEVKAESTPDLLGRSYPFTGLYKPLTR